MPTTGDTSIYSIGPFPSGDGKMLNMEGKLTTHINA